MSNYYYGYYTEDYGNEEAPAHDMMHHEDDKEKSPMVMAYMLVPLFDGISYYVTNDAWSAANNSDWDNAANSMLAGAIFKGLVKVGTMAMMDSMKPVFFMTAGLSAVWEAANLYLINKAHGTAASSNNSTKIAVGLSTVSLGLSAAAFMDMKSMKKDDEHHDMDKEAGAADDDYGYGYNYGYTYY